jgi:hypothetical protein
MSSARSVFRPTDRIAPIMRASTPIRRHAHTPIRLFGLGVAVEVQDQRFSHIRLNDLLYKLDVERVLFKDSQTLFRIEIDRDKKNPRIQFIRPPTASHVSRYRDLKELDTSLHHDHFELSSADIWLQFIENDVMKHELFRL